MLSLLILWSSVCILLLIYMVSSGSNSLTILLCSEVIWSVVLLLNGVNYILFGFGSALVFSLLLICTGAAELVVLISLWWDSRRK